MLPNRVFINQFESVCSAGETSEKLFSNICTHKSGISLVKNGPEKKTVALGKIVTLYDTNTLLYSICNHILNQSNLHDFSNTLLVVGSSVGGMQQSEQQFFEDHHYGNICPNLHTINSTAYRLMKLFTFKDNLSFSTACTSSANALGFGFEVIKKGFYENVLVLGFDTLSQTTIHGFNALGILSSSPCKPFDNDRDGMNVAEGLAVLLLQNEQKKRSVEVLGVGYSSDAHHMTLPHPDGALVAMRKALGKINPKKINYINAHGTGTIANDENEIAAIETLFGKSPFVSSTKSITGHTLGAAGALEAIICANALLSGCVPPNTNLENPMTKKVNLPTKPIYAQINYALSNSLAFGGNNTSILFGLPK